MRFLACVLLLASCHSTPTFDVKSPAFKNGELLPKQFTADGANVSPPLTWGPLPAGTQSVAVLCEDPDAPDGVFTHWIVFNLPPATTSLAENAAGLTQGLNDFNKPAYRGPDPPAGKPHRHIFKVFAIDRLVDLKPGAARDAFLKSIEGHVLGEGSITGRYGR
jgi:hypothetical protein